MKNIYVCGPTVYDKPHIGNLKPILTFDIFIRANRFLGEEVNFVHNITDIDDKIINKAKELNKTEAEVAKANTDYYLKTLKEFNVQTPTHMPSVVNNIKGITDFIEKLVISNHAYEIDGNVYFDVMSLKNYGWLSNRRLDEMKYEKGEGKKHPADFALWKNTTDGIKYDSPWGEGRPGWHTECAYFIDKYFNSKTIDIHGGGIDLLFPHHENENAQFEAKNNMPIAKEFVHTGIINFKGEKMSKSLGNLLTTKHFKDTYGVNVMRYILMSSSLTGLIELSDEFLEASVSQVKKLEKAYFKAVDLVGENIDEADIKNIILKFANWEFAQGNKLLIKEIKAFNTENKIENAKNIIMALDTLGFKFSRIEKSADDKALIEEWEALRAKGDYEKADELREKLIEKNLI